MVFDLVNIIRTNHSNTVAMSMMGRRLPNLDTNLSLFIPTRGPNMKVNTVTLNYKLKTCANKDIK